MILNKTVKNGAVDSTERVGKYLKVMGCESAFRMRAFSQNGTVLLDSQVEAGFELDFSQPFVRITYESELDQKLRLWVSEHRLNYDALSTKASRSQSFLAAHAGQSQMLLPHDAGQYRAKVVCESQGCWIGGEGVNRENGLYLPAGSIYNHDSAAPLHAYVNATPSYIADFDAKQEIDIAGDLECRSWTINEATQTALFKDQLNDIKLIDLQSGAITSVSGNSSGLPCSYKNGFALGANTEHLVIVGADGSYSAIFNPHAVNGQSIKAVCQSGDGLLLFCATQVDADNALMYYQDGVFELRPLASEMLRKDVKMMTRDPSDGVIWFVVDTDIYITEDEFATVQPLGISTSTGVQTEFLFGSKYITIWTQNGITVINRETRQEVALGATFSDEYAVLPVGEQLLIVAGDTVYVSGDEYASYTIAYQHGKPFADRIYNMATFSSGEVLLWVNDSISTELVKFPLEVDLSKPVAQFKVFKEAY